MKKTKRYVGYMLVFMRIRQCNSQETGFRAKMAKISHTFPNLGPIKANSRGARQEDKQFATLAAAIEFTHRVKLFSGEPQWLWTDAHGVKALRATNSERRMEGVAQHQCRCFLGSCRAKESWDRAVASWEAQGKRLVGHVHFTIQQNSLSG